MVSLAKHENETISTIQNETNNKDLETKASFDRSTCKDDDGKRNDDEDELSYEELNVD